MLERIFSTYVDCSKRQAAVGKKAKAAVQKMASLLADRVILFEPPFCYVSVHCFGPLEVRQGRITLKRYGEPFTCMTVQAIHMKIAYSLHTCQVF